MNQTSQIKDNIHFSPEGDQALLIRVGKDKQLNLEINRFCLALSQYLQSCSIDAVYAIIPALSTISVIYEASKLPQPAYQSLCDQLMQKIEAFDENDGQVADVSSKTVQIPICYDLEYALDLDHIAKQANLTYDEVIQLHQAQAIQVLTLGFAPGMAFLGMFPEAFNLPRRATPRAKIPAGSVAIANRQGVLYPSETPGGWHIIGRTPLALFNASQAPYVPFAPGDKIQFKAISKEEFLNFNLARGSHD